MTVADIKPQIRNYIVENFLYMREDFELGDNDSLLGNGILDSMGVMEVVSFLEEQFGIAVADADVTEENLGSIGAIATYLMQQGAAEEIRQSA